MQSTVIALETDIPMSATQVSAAPEPSTARKVPGGYRFAVLALLSGAMLWLCHFPVSWGWLVWIALVPMLPLVRADIRARWRYCCAWVAGTVYFWPALSWMTVADSRMIGGWALLALYCSLYFPLAIFLVRRLERGTPLPLVLTLPVVWTALEFFRSWFGTGFSWYLLAHTQHDALQVIQIADLGGAFSSLRSMLPSSKRCRACRGFSSACLTRRLAALAVL
jgi:apolipoprotein N-acyltransferase